MRHLSLLVILLIAGCAAPDEAALPSASRAAALGPGAEKVAPAQDIYPPVLHAPGWKDPVPLGPPVNTAGAEDSPFITPDGDTLYLFFTPDPDIPPEKQLLDNVTGIWVSGKSAGGAWGEPERVVLQEPGKMALDGCAYVQGQAMWFCSAREGYSGVNLFTARKEGGRWVDIRYAGDKLMKDYGMGEMHLSSGGDEIYFHSGRAGGKGEYDIWVTRMAEGGWQEPQNVGALNTEGTEGWPYLSSDGSELWFTRFHEGSPAIFRSRKAGDAWGEPELIISRFAGEPSLDDAGNIYFVHHFFRDGKMLEADIYVAYKE